MLETINHISKSLIRPRLQKSRYFKFDVITIHATFMTIGEKIRNHFNNPITELLILYGYCILLWNFNIGSTSSFFPLATGPLKKSLNRAIN